MQVRRLHAVHVVTAGHISVARIDAPVTHAEDAKSGKQEDDLENGDDDVAVRAEKRERVMKARAVADARQTAAPR